MLYKSVTVTLKQVICGFACIGFAIIIFANSKISATGAIDGLKLCGEIIIPSLFPFMVLTSFFQKSGGLEPIQKLLTPLTNCLFGLSGKEFAVFLLSLVSGYPVGASMLCDLYKSGQITERKANSMLTFCVNGGPAFIVMAVGNGILGNKSLGVRLLICHIIASCIIMSVVANLVREKNLPQKPQLNTPIGDAFVLATKNSCNAIFMISGYVVLFSVITALLTAVFGEFAITNAILPFLEVTLGLCGPMGVDNLYAVSFLLGFGGFSVMFQVLSGCRELKPNFFVVFLSRLAHGFISSIILKISLVLFPESVSVMAGGLTVKGYSGSLSLSVALTFMCVVFMFFVNEKLYVENSKIM